MRILEIVLLLLILLGLLRPFLPRHSWLDWLLLTPIPLTLLHWLLEGPRWQMIPAYGFVLLLAVGAAGRLRHQPSWPRGRQIAGALLGLILFIPAAALPYLLPVPQPLPPSGPYAIGTFTLHRVDQSRREIYSDDPTARRELLLQIWYPADPNPDDVTAPYLEHSHIFGPALAGFFELPPFLFNHINLARTAAFANAPMAPGDQAYPLILFSHGLNGFRGQNTTIVQELASYGYIVATIDHTYGNVVSIFPDGRSIFRSPDLFSEEGDPPRTGQTLVQVWAEDLAFTLDELARLNNTTAGGMNGRLDLSRVGIFGHSTGGGATLTLCQQDPRCTAGLALDSWLIPTPDDIETNPPPQPFMFINTPAWISPENTARGQRIIEAMPEQALLLTIAGADHFDFSDLPLFSPLTHQLGLTGTINGRLMTEILNRHVLAFFDSTLRGQDSDLLLASPYEEVTLVNNGR
jgi:predicted dienelactone hydrolase